MKQEQGSQFPAMYNEPPVCPSHTYTYCTPTDALTHSSWHVFADVEHALLSGIKSTSVWGGKKITIPILCPLQVLFKMWNVCVSVASICTSICEPNMLEYKSQMLGCWPSHYSNEGVILSSSFCCFFKLDIDMLSFCCQLLFLFSFPVPGPPVRMMFPDVRLTSVRVVWQPPSFPNGIILGMKANTDIHKWADKLLKDKAQVIGEII